MTFWRSLRLRFSKDKQEKLFDVLEELIETELVGKSRSEMNLKDSQAAAALLEPFRDQDNVFLDLRNFLIQKRTDANGQTWVRLKQLTTEERDFLDRNPRFETIDQFQAAILAERPS